MNEEELARIEGAIENATDADVWELYDTAKMLLREIRRLNKVIYDMGLPDEPVKGGSPSPDAASIPNGWGSKL